MFTRILVANRGEIAIRVIRACRELGIEPVAIYSEPDRAAMHVRQADHAVAVGPAPARESYLNGERIIEAARRTGAQAIHPGYGFLSENAQFARSVEAAGLVFIGPPATAIEKMGDKVAARRLMAEAGVPVVPGSPGTVSNEKEARAAIRRIGYPVMLKAAAGGGGKGMRVVERESELAGALRAVTSEASSSFGDARFYLEKALSSPRHIEVQVLGDRAGNLVHLFERECSIQRRHQKVIEESPSPFVTDRMRRAMTEVAVRAAAAVGYYSAGTIEFLADADRNFYFLEMNTRIQVEHPVTEMVTGTDLVKAQIAIAAGEPLPFRQEDVVQRGWALECRIYAEDAEQGFVPSPGRIETLRFPEGPGVRNDAGVYAGAEVSAHYDPLISKLVAWGTDRASAISRMRRALAECVIAGSLVVNLDFHRWMLAHPAFLSGDFDTGFVDREFTPRCGDSMSSRRSAEARDASDFMAALLVAAVAAETNGARRAQAERPKEGLAPWKALGRLQMLRE